MFRGVIFALLLALPLFPIDLQAWGNNLAATAVLTAGLVWHILHPPDALPPAAGKLKPDAISAPSETRTTSDSKVSEAARTFPTRVRTQSSSS